MCNNLNCPKLCLSKKFLNEIKEANTMEKMS